MPPVSLDKRRQRLLRAEVRIQLALHRSAAVGSRAAQASRGGIAHRRQRLQAARIHAVDRHVRAHRLIGRRAHARLVLNALPRQPAAEVQQALALVDPLQRLRNRANRIQLAVRIQALYSLSSAVKLDASSAVPPELPPSLPFANPVPSVPLYLPTPFSSSGLVRRKVLVHAQRRVQAHQRHQIGRLHLLVDVVLRRLHRAVDVLRLHAAQVEEHHNQPMVLQRRRVRAKFRFSRSATVALPVTVVFSCSTAASSTFW